MSNLKERRKELETKVRNCSTEIADLLARDAMTDEQSERLDRQQYAMDRAMVALEENRRMQLDEVARFSRMPGHVESSENPVQFMNRIEGAEMWAETDHRSDPTQLRDQALAIVERGDASIERGDASDQMPVEPEDRARVEKLLRNDKHGDLATYVLAASRPAYLRAVNESLAGRRDLLSDEERAAIRAVDETRIRSESRAALSTTGANGGYMIPFFLDPSVIITGAGATNPFRQICRVETIPTNVWHGVSSAGVTAEWTSEAAEMTDASPTFVQPTITPQRADAWIQSSWEVAQDAVDLAGQLAVLFADAKNVLEVAAFTNGTGSTQPEGIVTRLNVTTNSKVATNTNGSFGAVDVYALVNSLPARAQDRAAFMAHWGVYNLARQFAGTALNSSLWVEFGGGIPAALVGAPAYKNSSMTASLSAATASTDNILILGDWSKYAIIDRIGMEVIDVPVVVGPNFRPTGSRGWAAFWRCGADATSPEMFRMLQA